MQRTGAHSAEPATPAEPAFPAAPAPAAPRVVHLEHRGQLERLLNHLAGVERRAQIHVEDPHARGRASAPPASGWSAATAGERCASEPKQMSVGPLGQLQPAVGQLQKIPGRRLMDGVAAASRLEGHRHPARLMRRVHLKKARIGRQRIQPLDRFAAQLVAPDAAQNHGVIAQPPSHRRKVRRSAAQHAGPSGKMIPEHVRQFRGSDAVASI